MVHESPHLDAKRTNVEKAAEPEAFRTTDSPARGTDSTPSPTRIEPAGILEKQTPAEPVMGSGQPTVADNASDVASRKDVVPAERKEESHDQPSTVTDAAGSPSLVTGQRFAGVNAGAAPPIVSEQGLHAAGSSQAHTKTAPASSSETANPASGPIFTALDRETDRPVLAAGVQAARLVEKLGQSEMHIGLRTMSFGSVEVHTTLRDTHVGVLIGSEKGDLRSVLTPEIPSLEASFRQHELRLDGLRFLESSTSLHSGLSPGADAHHRFFQPPRLAAQASEPAADRAELPRNDTEGLTAQVGLNVHA